HRRPRLLEVNAHHDLHAFTETELHLAQSSCVFERGLFAMYGARANDGNGRSNAVLDARFQMRPLVEHLRCCSPTQRMLKSKLRRSRKGKLEGARRITGGRFYFSNKPKSTLLKYCHGVYLGSE